MFSFFILSFFFFNFYTFFSYWEIRLFFLYCLFFSFLLFHSFFLTFISYQNTFLKQSLYKLDSSSLSFNLIFFFFLSSYLVFFWKPLDHIKSLFILWQSFYLFKSFTHKLICFVVFISVFIFCFFVSFW